MDNIPRNRIMAEHEYLIKSAIRRNIALIKALRLETDDVYQDLMISMLKAIEAYDSTRSDFISAHIFAKLQYAILDMKRRHKPGCITGTGNTRISLVSVECFYDDGSSLDIPVEDDISPVEWSDILSILQPFERETLEMKINGQPLIKKHQRNDFSIACEKLLAMI
jgi:DNA-directed RNA polymerase specialized sigma24 family protein